MSVHIGYFFILYFVVIKIIGNKNINKLRLKKVIDNGKER